MNREEILAKAKGSKNQEYENNIANGLMKQSTIFLAIICIILFFIRVIHADIQDLQRATSSEAVVIMCGVSCFNSLSLYKKLKDKRNLYLGLLLLIFFVISFINFMLGLFG
ncbi:DUF6442 family protein [Irregularibacter muris]|uniref:DUF6442 family protein n=1 Tax=Irregularibacter muris TaxID=1796619 RepID=A0AAE3HCX7_9FIRM|nr:DUF6442 family protein [Irregularibacter muris]MCR1897506.1 DUF6442 family protein [Irregularibacter muris]